MPAMDVPKPVYDRMLRVKTELSIARGRQVIWPEVFETIMDHYEATGQLLADVKASGQ